MSELHWALRLHSTQFFLLNSNYYSNNLFMMMVFTWGHGGHVGVQKNSLFEKILWEFGNLILLLYKTWATHCHCLVHGQGLISTWVQTKLRTLVKDTNMAAVPLLRDNNMTAVVSHENTPTLLDYFGTLLHCILCHAPLFILYLSFLPGVRGASPLLFREAEYSQNHLVGMLVGY